jgi:hypothetical protein
MHCPQEFASLMKSAVADAEPTHSITVRIARTGGAARIEVLDEHDVAPSDAVIGSMTIPLAPGASSAADA